MTRPYIVEGRPIPEVGELPKTNYRVASPDYFRALGVPLRAGRVFNCTYSQLNALLYRSGLPAVPLKHELAEMALVDVPPQLKSLGITVMDGAFFSCMPFPPRGLHTLSHVRYTPHGHWYDGLPGEPHVDAVTVAAAIYDLDTEARFRDRIEALPLFGDLAGIAGEAVGSIMSAT